MSRENFKIVPMRASHRKDCDAIVASSDPWKQLGESIRFGSFLRDRKMVSRAYVCMAGRQTAGFVLFTPEPVFARGGYLRALGVAPAFRGQGVGRKLLSFAEQQTAKRALHFFLCASSFNRGAQAFYRKCGYTKVGTLPGFIIPGASEYIFWKRLVRNET